MSKTAQLLSSGCVKAAAVAFLVVFIFAVLCPKTHPFWLERDGDGANHSPSLTGKRAEEHKRFLASLWQYIYQPSTPLQGPGDLVQQSPQNAPSEGDLEQFQQFTQNAPSEGDFRLVAQCSVSVPNRLDCFPESIHPKPEACKTRGCCWDNSTNRAGAPACYFSRNIEGYKAVSVSPLKQGNITVGLNATLKRTSASPFPKDVNLLRLLVFYEAKFRVRFKIFNPAAQRYEVPVSLHDQDTPTPEEDADFKVSISKDPFSISITRKIDGQPLFDSRGMAPLIFADQYLQIGSHLSSPFVYGLGEHRSNFLLNVQWQKLVFWNRDQYPEENSNLYGSHPFCLNLEPTGRAHGVFLLNSNAMQVDLQPYDKNGAITYRVTGGILDFFVFSGPSSEDVVRQYVSLIGSPIMPPFWSLGFHLCKHGYGNSSEFWKVIQRNRAAKMPYDVQWNDLDYAEGNKMWTWDDKTYKGLPQIIQDLHVHGQHNVIIVDPSVSSSQPKGSYPPYDLGMKLGIFMNNYDGKPLIGKAWPGKTVFVDFFHPSALNYWLNFVSLFHSILPFDGLWIDMNEPSNFVDGSITGCTNNSLDNPPFVPPGIDGGTLYAKTVCPSAQQQFTSHYNLHNLYGWSETIITSEILRVLSGKRPFVISRSTSPGSGNYGGHWTGDNLSSFPDMRFSIPGILNSNLFGIPMVGANICGFRGNTTRELCIRWMQLGAFYPFMWNHAEGYSVPQDPGWFDSQAQAIMRAALETRYSLLPFLYTLFFVSHITGAPVARPLFFDYPGTESIDQQFLWGRELLISPVLEKDATTVKAYIPKGSWYDLHDLTLLNVTGGHTHELAAPLEKINVHVRGGSILPMLSPAITTTLMRQGKMELLVAPDLTSQPFSAAGQLYWDDGESLDTVREVKFTFINFVLNKTTLKSELQQQSYGPLTLGKVTVMGVDPAPLYVTLGGRAVDFSFDDTTKVLNVPGLSQDLLMPFELTWH